VPKESIKLLLAPELPPTLNYNTEEELWEKDEERIKGQGSWWKLPDQRLFVPSTIPSGKTTT
jgi:hypothetical protein